MRRNKMVILFTAILVLILLTLSYRVGGQIYRNQQKMDNSSYNSKVEQYQRKIPMGEMNFLEYDSYFEIPQTAVSIKVPNVMVLPKKIQYFTEQDGKKSLALDIAKGTSILWIPTEEINDIYIGYGLHSYPTYDKGWRYARPFIPSNQQTDIERLPYYFVRTKDLEAVAKIAFNSTEYLMKSMQNQRRSVEDAVFLYTRFIDNIFYDKGVFYSPDLLHPVWYRVDTVLLCLSAVFLLIAWLLRRTLGISK